MSEKRPGIILLSKYADVVAEMPAEDAGMLLKGVYAYDAGEDLPKMTPLAKALFILIRSDIQEHAERYERTCRRNRENVRKRWNKRSEDEEDKTYGRIRPYTKGHQKYQGEEEEEVEEEGENIYMSADSHDNGIYAKADNIHALLTRDERERFEKFWSVYPRRESRARAEAAWRELQPDEDLTARILRAVESACASDPRFQTRQYIPHPANWLARREWENEYEAKHTTKDADYGSWTTD